VLLPASLVVGKKLFDLTEEDTAYIFGAEILNDTIPRNVRQ
jgi:hypothetical protein